MGFISSKSRSLYHQRIKPVKLTWTQAWRAFNKKDTAERVVRRTKRKVVRVQKGVVGMTIDEIKRRQQESKEDRQKMADKLAADVKDRKIKQAKGRPRQRRLLQRPPERATARLSSKLLRLPDASVERDEQSSLSNIRLFPPDESHCVS